MFDLALTLSPLRRSVELVRVDVLQVRDDASAAIPRRERLRDRARCNGCVCESRRSVLTHLPSDVSLQSD